MDYYKNLKREDFASDDDYLLERVKRGLAAGFTYQQCCYPQLTDFSLALGLSKADIPRNRGTQYRLHFFL